MNRHLLILALFTAAGCSGTRAPFGDPVADGVGKEDGVRGATDKRVPELGTDRKIVRQSKVSLSDALAAAETANGPTIEAKFELDDSGKLSLSIYPAANGIATEATLNKFEELSGDPTATPFAPGLEVFHDQEHLTRSARDLTLIQLSRYSVRDAVAIAEQYGQVYWTIPTIHGGRAGYGIYLLGDDNRSYYAFLDGDGEDDSRVEELADGPGQEATDQRAPELGSDLSVLRSSKTSMLDALVASEKKYGATIEAKFELDDSGKLSLSIYPIGKGIATDAERNTFGELAGDPTAATFAPDFAAFAIPDEEHLLTSARDLTLVQTASMSLIRAVKEAQEHVPGGMVYWAIPTIRDTRSGYGIYIYDQHNRVHYLFVS